MERIAALYAIEEEIRGRPAEKRKQVRQARAKPLLASLREWFEATLPKLSRKSDTTAAIRAESQGGTPPLIRNAGSQATGTRAVSSSSRVRESG
jgi:hypothetical protein